MFQNQPATLSRFAVCMAAFNGTAYIAYFSDSTIKVTGAFSMGDSPHTLAEVSKLKPILDFVLGVPFKHGLTDFLGWTAEQASEGKAAYLRSVNASASHGLIGRTSFQ